MTRVAEGVLLSLWIHASEQRSVSRRYSRVIIRSYDKNFSIPFVQVIGSKLGLPCEIKHALVLVNENLSHKIGSDCFVQVCTPKFRLGMIGGAECREQYFIPISPELGRNAT
jgi:hypothetical protein